MKVLITAVIALAMLCGVQAHAQSFYSPQYREPEAFAIALKNTNTRSIRGWKTGVSLGLQWKQRLSAELIYLTSLNRAELPNDQFSGLQITYLFPITSSLRLGPALRTGVYNEQFFHLLPSAKAQVDLSERIFTELAYAHSDGFPFFEMNIGFKIFRK